MAFRIPAARFDDVHNTSSTAPNGQIRLHIRCDEGDCAAGRFGVSVREADSGEEIAHGAVVCSGSFQPHDLEMTAARSLQQARVRLVFSCGAEQQEGRSGRIWYRNE